MNTTRRLQELAGIKSSHVAEDSRPFIFADVDPQTGEYHEIARGSIEQILFNLEHDAENSGLAEVLRNMSAANSQAQQGGRAMPYDGFIYLLIAL